MAHRYQVLIHGKGFSAPTNDGDGIIGFYVIRRVRADTQAEAYWTAVRAIEREEKFRWLVEETREHTGQEPRYKFELEDIGYLPWWRWYFTRAPRNYAFYSEPDEEISANA